MNAADVLAAARLSADRTSAALVAALLAHGERGVAILPDGTLWAVEHAHGGHPWETFYRLVPLSAEATDDQEDQ